MPRKPALGSQPESGPVGRCLYKGCLLAKGNAGRSRQRWAMAGSTFEEAPGVKTGAESKGNCGEVLGC